VLKLSFSTGALYHLPLRVAFSLARHAGFDGVELVEGAELLLRGAAHARRLSHEYGLPVLSVHPPIVPYPGMDDARPTVRRLVTLAEGVDSNLVVLHTPKTASTESPAWRFFVQALQEHTDPAVRLTLETSGYFRPGDERCVLHDVRRLQAFAEGRKLNVTFDTAHTGTTPYPILEAYALFNGRVANVHLSDLARRRLFPNWRPLHTFLLHHQMPGAGVLPLTEFLRMLLRGGYAGPLTLELSPTAVQAWSLARVRANLERAVRFVRDVEDQTRRFGDHGEANDQSGRGQTA